MCTHEELNLVIVSTIFISHEGYLFVHLVNISLLRFTVLCSTDNTIFHVQLILSRYVVPFLVNFLKL